MIICGYIGHFVEHCQVDLKLLSLDIYMQILPTVLYVFLMVLLGRICFSFKAGHFVFRDYFRYSHYLHV